MGKNYHIAFWLAFAIACIAVISAVTHHNEAELLKQYIKDHDIWIQKEKLHPS
jgi:hypothetical protein